ncbi:hypothetical protein GGF46_000094 [Coemansia sp. RSA 552]|nr:hypothetical protein GGF46_000094 [Coemansia sp. RSA 552]
MPATAQRPAGMARIQLSSLDEFVASLSQLDYEAAKMASGKVMEDHIRMGALMFSLLTIEMTYTSMDYLTPENFRRGNNYLLNMYSPLPRQLNKLLRKLVAEYEEEHQRLISLRIQPAARGPAAHGGFDRAAHRSVTDISAQREAADGQSSKRPTPPSQAAHQGGSRRRGGSDGRGTHLGSARPVTEYHSGRPHADSDTAEPFDPNLYLANMEEAEKVLEELETVRQFVEFITRFVEVRKTMVVLYRFIAITGPVLYVHKLRTMLDHCTEALGTIEANPLYSILLEHVRQEVLLVYCLIDWDAHIQEYDIVQSVTHMKRAKRLLKSWQSALPRTRSPAGTDAKGNPLDHSIYDNIGEALGGRRDKGAGGDGRHGSHGLLYTALAKSSQMVQSFLWRTTGSGPSIDTERPATGEMRAIVVWISSWVDYLSFKTTTYFQQIIVPYRSLYHDDLTMEAKQDAVMRDAWARPGISKSNLYDVITNFLHANDGCFVTLLFESSKQHPFSADGFAVSGTRIDVPDYRVQACAVLFCFTNQKLLHSRGISVSGSLVHDLHSTRSDPTKRDAMDAHRQSDVEWFRQNCLPDILYILDNDHATLDLELLGSSPLLSQLGHEADDLLVELSDSVHDTVEEASTQLAISKEAASARAATERVNASNGTSLAGQYANSAKLRSGNAPEALRLSAVKAISAADQRQRPATRPDSKHDASSVHSMPVSSHIDSPGPQHHSDGLGGGISSVATIPAALPADTAPPTLPGSESTGLDGGLSLYSTYLQKSHLRNNVHSTPARDRGGVQTPAEPAQTHELGHTSHDGAGHEHGEHAGALAPSTEDVRSQPAPPPLPAPALPAKSPAVALTTSDHRAGARAPADAAHPGDGGWTLDSVASRRMSADPTSSAGATRVSSAYGYNSLPRRSGRAATSTLATSNAKMTRRPSLSIRSFFRPMPRAAAAQSRTAATSSLTTFESEITRRVRYGERLRELFGSWCPEDESEDVDDLVLYGSESNRSPSTHSLSFSTPMRASLGGRAHANAVEGASAGAGAGITPGNTDAEASGGRFVLRLPRSSVQPRAMPVRSTGSRPPATRRASEFGLGAAVEYLQHRGHSQKAQPSRAYQAKLQTPHVPQQQPPSPRAVPHGAQCSVTPGVAGGSEGYTYLYSRVGLPNLVLAAVFLDTDKGLDRRREAERTWDGVVDAVRGAPLFDKLTSLHS